MAKGVWIIAEQRDGALRKISFELASAARKLADQLGAEVSAVLLGSGIEGLAAQLGKYGVDKVYVGDNRRHWNHISPKPMPQAAAKILKKTIRQSCFWAHPFRAKILSARVAAKLATGSGHRLYGCKNCRRQTCGHKADVCRQMLRRSCYQCHASDGIASSQCFRYGGKCQSGGSHEIRSRRRRGSNQE